MLGLEVMVSQSGWVPAFCSLELFLSLTGAVGEGGTGLMHHASFCMLHPFSSPEGDAERGCFLFF